MVHLVIYCCLPKHSLFYLLCGNLFWHEIHGHQVHEICVSTLISYHTVNNGDMDESHSNVFRAGPEMFVGHSQFG